MSSTLEYFFLVALPAIVIGIVDTIRRLRGVHFLVNSKHHDALAEIVTLKEEVAKMKKQISDAIGKPDDAETK